MILNVHILLQVQITANSRIFPNPIKAATTISSIFIAKSTPLLSSQRKKINRKHERVTSIFTAIETLKVSQRSFRSDLKLFKLAQR